MVDKNQRKYAREEIRAPEMAARVKAVLDEKGWSQADLVKAAGISRSLASRLINGVRSPSSDTTHKVAKALGVSTDYLISGGDLAKAEDIAPDVIEFLQKYWGKLDNGDKTLLRVTIGHLQQKVQDNEKRDK